LENVTIHATNDFRGKIIVHEAPRSYLQLLPRRLNYYNLEVVGRLTHYYLCQRTSFWFHQPRSDFIGLVLRKKRIGSYEEDGKMAGLVSYDSADSENEEISQSKCERNEVIRCSLDRQIQ